MDEQGIEDETSAKFYSLRHPDSNTHILCDIPVDYEFNDLIANIAKQLSDDDIEEIKTRLKGDRGLKGRVRENIKSGFVLLDALQRDSFIDRDNILLLQALLYRMNKHELFDLAVEYAQTKGNVIHFKKPPDEPPNGYTYVQIHIGGIHTDGQNVNQYSRSFLEALKAHAARLMFALPEHVIIAGIEPSNSLLITLMIRNEHIKYIKRAAERKDCISEWIHFGVDTITIEGKEYSLTDQLLSGGLESETEKKLKNYYELYEEAEKKLECREVEIMELKRKVQSSTGTDKNDSVRTDSEAEKQLEHLTQKYEEAQRTLKANEDKILQLKSKLFDFIQKNEKNEEDKKKLSDIIYNESSLSPAEIRLKQRHYSSGSLFGELRDLVLDECDIDFLLSRHGTVKETIRTASALK